MRAVVLRSNGGPEVLALEDLPPDVPGPMEVRVRVRAVALNHMDIWVRKGGPAFKTVFPFRLGCDVAGEVESVGAGVTDVEVGTKCVVQPGVSCGRCAQCLSGHDNLCRWYKILGENTNGGYGELLVVPRANVAPYPGALSWRRRGRGAAHVSHRVADARAQSARAAGRRRPRPRCGRRRRRRGGADREALRRDGDRHGEQRSEAREACALGAAHGIDYTKEDFVAAAKKLTDKRGVDVVIDHVGGETFAKSILAARAGGRVVTCGATAGFETKIDLRHVFFRQVELLGSTMGSKADLLAVLPHVAKGTLRPVVDRVLPLADAREAHRALEAREVFGKLLEV